MDHLVDEHKLTKVKACKAIGLSRSEYYKPRVAWSAKDAEVDDALRDMVEFHTRWGFWKCFHRFRADGKSWNHKRVYCVYCSMKLNLKWKVKKRIITRQRQPFEDNQQLKKIWALHFMRDSMYDWRPFRTLNVINEGNREALRIECETSIPSGRLVRVMDQLIELYGLPEAIRLAPNSHLRALRNGPNSTKSS